MVFSPKKTTVSENKKEGTTIEGESKRILWIEEIIKTVQLSKENKLFILNR